MEKSRLGSGVDSFFSPQKETPKKEIKTNKPEAIKQKKSILKELKKEKTVLAAFRVP